MRSGRICEPRTQSHLIIPSAPITGEWRIPPLSVHQPIPGMVRLACVGVLTVGLGGAASWRCPSGDARRRRCAGPSSEYGRSHCKRGQRRGSSVVGASCKVGRAAGLAQGVPPWRKRRRGPVGAAMASDVRRHFSLYFASFTSSTHSARSFAPTTRSSVPSKASDCLRT